MAEQITPVRSQIFDQCASCREAHAREATLVGSLRIKGRERLIGLETSCDIDLAENRKGSSLAQMLVSATIDGVRRMRGKKAESYSRTVKGEPDFVPCPGLRQAREDAEREREEQDWRRRAREPWNYSAEDLIHPSIRRGRASWAGDGYRSSDVDPWC